jgi:hypothetical protein
MEKKLTELLRKCEEFYDISNKKYSDSVWKEKYLLTYLLVPWSTVLLEQLTGL